MEARRGGGGGVGDVLALLQLDLVAVLDELLVGALPGAAGRVLDDGPEVGDAEDDVRAGERSLEGLCVVEVALDEFDAPRGPGLGGVRCWVASDTADLPPWGFKICVRDRAALGTDISEVSREVDGQSSGKLLTCTPVIPTIVMSFDIVGNAEWGVRKGMRRVLYIVLDVLTR